MKTISVLTAPLRRRLFSYRRRSRSKGTTAPDYSTRITHATTLGLFIFLFTLLGLGSITQFAAHVLSWLVQTFALPLNVQLEPFRLGGLLQISRIALHAELPRPETFTLVLHAIFAGGVFIMSWATRSRPWRSGLQFMCMLHGVALLMCVFGSDQSLFSLQKHTRTLADLSLILILLTPLLLACGYYIVERSWINRLTATALILAYEILALPLKLLLHALLVTQVSAVSIPLLFFSAGPLLDVLLLSALYGWVITWQMPHERSFRWPPRQT